MKGEFNGKRVLQIFLLLCFAGGVLLLFPAIRRLMIEIVEQIFNRRIWFERWFQWQLYFSIFVILASGIAIIITNLKKLSALKMAEIMVLLKNVKCHLIELSSRDSSIFIYGLIIGAVFFLGIYGHSRIIPWNADWLMVINNDTTISYLGWVAYRESPWSFPFGMINRLSYPLTTSIIFTDSIPVLAVFFKILSPILPSTFQYVGLFVFGTYALQGGFGALLFRKMKCSFTVSLIGAAIFTFVPPLTLRIFNHSSLGSQWIILAALCLWLSHDIKFKRKYTYIALWCTLAFVTVGIHLYMAVMFFIVLFGYCLNLVLKRTQLKIVAMHLLLPLGSTLIAIFMFGGFSVDNNPQDNSYQLYGNNYFTSNMVAFFDSNDWSLLGWPDFPNATGGQIEGFAYLGFGVIVLVMIVLFTLAVRGVVRFDNNAGICPKQMQPEKIAIDKPATANFSLRKTIIEQPQQFSYVVVIVISLLLGMGSVITLFDKTLFSWPLPERLKEIWGIFRATGRFTWIAYYMIIAIVIKFITTQYKNVGKYLIIFSLILQLMDLYPFSRFSQPTGRSSPLANPIWNEISGYSHIYFGLDVYSIYNLNLTFAVTKFALENNMTINQSYIARPPRGMPYPFAQSPDTLYIYNSGFIPWATGMSAYALDNLIVSATNDTTGNLHAIMSKYQELRLFFDGVFQILPNTSGIVIQDAVIAEDGSLYTNGVDVHVLLGPYFPALDGSFNFTLNYEVLENLNNNSVVGIFEIVTDYGSYHINGVGMLADETSITISGVSFPNLSHVFETRIFNLNGAKLRIISIDITNDITK